MTAFFATLQSPVMPLLPSFWAGETLFAALPGRLDWLHAAALWTTRPGPHRAGAPGLRPPLLRRLEQGAGGAQGPLHAPARAGRACSPACPLRPELRSLLLKDLKVFLRDTTQWSQLLLLLALVLVYLYNFKVLDLERIPYMSGVIKNAYAFVNLAMAAFVLSAVAVRFVFPAVSAEGPAFWLVRSSPLSMRRFLWSKFWIGLPPDPAAWRRP